MSMVYCRSCGNQVHETVRFCPDCGASQTQASSSSIQDSVSQAIKKSDFPPITEFLFSSKGRVTRFQLWMSLIANFVIQLFLFQMAKSSDNIGILIIYTAVIIYPTIVILIKRCRDIGLSPKYLWLLLVPLIGFIPLFALLFNESDGNDNSISNDAENILKNNNSTTNGSTAPDVSYKSSDSSADENSIIDEVFDSKPSSYTTPDHRSYTENNASVQHPSSSKNFDEESVSSATVQSVEPLQTQINQKVKRNTFKDLVQLSLAFVVLGLVVAFIAHIANPPYQPTLTLPQNEPQVINNDSNQSTQPLQSENSDQSGANTTPQPIPEAPKTSNIIDPKSYQVMENLGGWSVSNASTIKDKSLNRGVMFYKIIMQNEVKYLFQIQGDSSADLADMTTSIPEGYSVADGNACSFKAKSSLNSFRTDIFAIVNYSEKTNNILKAWRVDIENNKFVELSPNDVKCKSNTEVGTDGDVD